MSKYLKVPTELLSLIEKRELPDRRNGERRGKRSEKVQATSSQERRRSTERRTKRRRKKG